MMVAQNSRLHRAVESRTPSLGGQSDEILRLIAPTVRWIAAQERARLRQSLGPQGERVMGRLAAEAREMEATVARQVEARLPEVLQAEVRRTLESALSAEGATVSPGSDVAGRTRDEENLVRRPTLLSESVPGSPSQESEEADSYWMVPWPVSVGMAPSRCSMRYGGGRTIRIRAVRRLRMADLVRSL